MATAEPNVDSDYQDVMLHCVRKGIQLMAVVAPPVILARQFYRRSFTVTGFLRRAGFNTFVIGAPVGFLAGWGRMRNNEDYAISDRAYRLKFSESQKQTDDFALTGGVLGSILTTAIFLRRVPLYATIAGGASLGITGGIITHLVVHNQGKKPTAMIEELRASPPLKKEIQDVQAGKTDKVIKGES